MKKLSVKFSSLKGRNFTIEAELILTGEDWVVILTGGKKHIGAVSLSSYGENKTRQTETLSVFDHKERLVSPGIADEISNITGRTTAVIAGMHWDSLDKEELSLVIRKIEELKLKIIKYLQCEK